MYEAESLKSTAEKITGLARPSARQLDRAASKVRPSVYRFKDNYLVPDNPQLPLVVYCGAVRLFRNCDPASIFEDLFERNGWADGWSNGIYDYVHFHPRIHEVLGIARGSGTVQFGGSTGRKVKLKAGDVAILPAETGHQLLHGSDNLLVVGAYPAQGKYMECAPTVAEHAQALKAIPNVPLPSQDPVFGKGGPLLKLWSEAS